MPYNPAERTFFLALLLSLLSTPMVFFSARWALQDLDGASWSKVGWRVASMAATLIAVWVGAYQVIGTLHEATLVAQGSSMGLWAVLLVHEIRKAKNRATPRR